MRSEQVLTNATCNQNCTFCTVRRATEDQAFIRPAAVRARIDAALAGGAREVVLTGGEPTLRRDLEALVGHAKAGGAESIVLETNGTTIDVARAAGLRDAGVTLARVHVSGGSAALDEVTRDEGGFLRSFAGLQALSQAGVKLEAAVTLVRSTRGLLPSLPAALAREGVRIIVATVPIDSPRPDELLSYDEAGAALAELDDAARAAGLLLQLSPRFGVPPCVLPQRARHAHLFALNPGNAARAGFTHVAACDECTAKDRCPGLPVAYLERRGPPPMRPIADERLRRRLSLVSNIESQIARELVTPNRREAPGGEAVEERIVRVNFHCNQACRFCFVSTHLPPAQEAQVREAIVEAARQGARVTLSGGEPTLNANLLEYVKLAKAHSSLPIELQTNAIRLDDPALVQKLADAGLDEAFVSLHGSTAEISDAITGAPGTFARTVVGLDNLVKSTIRLTLNFVICQRNHLDLEAFVRLAGTRWPGAIVNISFVAASTDVVPRDTQLIPRYSDAMGPLAKAVAAAAELDVRIVGFQGMCGIPLCLVPGELERYFEAGDIPDGFDAGEFLKAEPCTTCELKTQCFGIRRGYAELYGTTELRSVTRSRS